MLRAPLACILALAFTLLPPGTAHSPEGTPKDYCEDSSEWTVHDYVGVGGPNVLLDGNRTGDCDGDGIPGDFDGHLEFGLGGAILDGGHHGNLICLDPPGLFQVNGGPIVAGGCTVAPLAARYAVRVLAGPAGHVYTL